jgi:hypothetical protein
MVLEKDNGRSLGEIRTWKRSRRNIRKKPLFFSDCSQYGMRFLDENPENEATKNG